MEHLAKTQITNLFDAWNIFFTCVLFFFLFLFGLRNSQQYCECLLLSFIARIVAFTWDRWHKQKSNSRTRYRIAVTRMQFLTLLFSDFFFFVWVSVARWTTINWIVFVFGFFTCVHMEVRGMVNFVVEFLRRFLWKWNLCYGIFGSCCVFSPKGRLLNVIWGSNRSGYYPYVLCCTCMVFYCRWPTICALLVHENQHTHTHTH